MLATYYKSAQSSRTLTGAWIETLKTEVSTSYAMSHPHGCVD